MTLAYSLVVFMGIQLGVLRTQLGIRMVAQALMGRLDPNESGSNYLIVAKYRVHLCLIIAYFQ